MNIPIILGTARKGRRSVNVANYLLKQAIKYGFESEIIDVRDFRIGATDATEKSDKAQKLAKIINKGDGIIIVSPEYNHGYPGELKMMIDMLYKQYSRKPVAFAGVSIGKMGGARAVEQLILLAVGVNMVPIKQVLYFPMVQDLFNEKGEIQDEAYDRRVKAFFDEITWYAKALKDARQSGEEK